MQTSWKNNAIAIFIVAVFLTPLLTSVHALDHLSLDDDAPIPCEQCDILAQSFELDSINNSTSFLDIEQATFPSSFVLIVRYEISKETIVLPSFIYNKPPPLS